MNIPVSVDVHSPYGPCETVLLTHVPRVGETVSFHDKAGVPFMSGVVKHVDWSFVRQVNGEKPFESRVTIILAKEM